MNENDRRFFLKRFFSFNNSSTTSFGSSSNCNGSFEEEPETVGGYSGGGGVIGNCAGEEDVVLEQVGTLRSSASGVLLPAITVEHVDDKARTMTRMGVAKKSSAPSTPGPASIRSTDEEDTVDVSTPSSTAPLILTRMDAFDNDSAAKAMLQQQNSIELKPFRRKEVQIADTTVSVSIVVDPPPVKDDDEDAVTVKAIENDQTQFADNNHLSKVNKAKFSSAPVNDLYQPVSSHCQPTALILSSTVQPSVTLNHQTFSFNLKYRFDSFFSKF